MFISLSGAISSPSCEMIYEIFECYSGPFPAFLAAVIIQIYEKENDVLYCKTIKVMHTCTRQNMRKHIFGNTRAYRMCNYYIPEQKPYMYISCFAKRLANTQEHITHKRAKSSADHTAARNRQDSITKQNMKPKKRKKIIIGRVYIHIPK